MTCVHHWMVDRPTHSKCPAVCKLCGDKTVFSGSLEEYYDLFSLRSLGEEERIEDGDNWGRLFGGVSKPG